MEDLDTFLSGQKLVILNSLDKLSKTAANIIVQKNNKILSLNTKNSLLNEDIKSKFKKNIKSITSAKELYLIKENNNLIKKLIRKERKNKELKKNILEIQREVNNKSFINTKDMTAFKIVALELEEKEKIIGSNKILIGKLENDNKSLLSELEKVKVEKLELENRIGYLENKNKDIENVNNLQINTIETITKELQNKNEKTMELKNYFMEILDNFNDLLQMVDEKCN